MCKKSVKIVLGQFIVRGYNSHKTGPLLQGMYAALHGYEKGLFSGCYSHPAKEMENGKNV